MKKMIFFFALLWMLIPSFAQDRTDSIHIAHYEINLSFVDFSGRRIEGYTDLKVVSKVDNLSYIDLDLQGLTVDSVKVNNSITSSYTHQSPRLLIQGITNFDEGDTLNLRVYYGGVPVGSQWGGVYFSGEYAYNMGTHLFAIPHSYGRVWYPCMDVFNDKATYTFNIRTQNGKKAICGGTLMDSVTLPDNTTIWKWELHDPIPTYLASFAVGEYQSYKDVYNGINGPIPIEIYAHSSDIGNVPGSFVNLKRILQIFEDRFGPCRWERVGYVVVPFNSGAMEHATNIAYPQYAVNGNLDNEYLLAHELGHFWFGNLITCAQAEDMWINEGFASYCEAIYKEILYPNADPDLDGYKSAVRRFHLSSLETAHLYDGGYFALGDMPQEVTYGTTTYHKGAAVGHTLRKYLGDDLFFPAMRALLDQYAYGNLTSQEMFTFLSNHTGVDLQDFYEGWVMQPGFLHFSVDSVTSLGANNYRVFVKQRLHQAHYFANSNIVDITFFSETGQTYTDSIHFSGQFGDKQVTIPFAPIYAIVDYNDKLSDAIAAYTILLKNTGSIDYPDEYFKVNVQGITDSVLFRMEHNYVAPDPLKNPNPDIYRISGNHYWRVEYVPVTNLQGTMQFKFIPSGTGMDYELMQGYTRDNLVLLYRRNPSQDWQIIPSTFSGTPYVGYIRTTTMMPGEYSLGIGDRSVGIIEKDSENIAVFPNPAKDNITVICENYSDFKHVVLSNIEGKEILRSKLSSQETKISISKIPDGTYFLRFYDDAGKIQLVKQVVIKK